MKPTLLRLQEASAGLLYISESEYPFEVFQFEVVPTSTEEMLLNLTDQSTGTAIEKVPVAQFFTPLIKTYPGATEEQEQAAKRFQQLQQTIVEELKGPAVYKVGKIQVDVFLMGNLPDRTYGGLKTRSIET